MKNKMFFSIALIFVLLACNETPYMQGKRLYTAKCQNCHMPNGEGLNNLIPTLDNAPILGSNEMICIIINGKSDSIISGNSFLVKEMPGFKSLSSTEVANIVNYVNHRWQKKFEEKTIQEIDAAIKDCLN